MACMAYGKQSAGVLTGTHRERQSSQLPVKPDGFRITDYPFLITLFALNLSQKNEENHNQSHLPPMAPALWTYNKQVDII